MYSCDICRKEIPIAIAKDECSFYWSSEDGSKRCRVRCFFHHINSNDEECHGGVCPDCQEKIFREALNINDKIWFVVGRTGIANLIAREDRYTTKEIKEHKKIHEETHPPYGKYKCRQCSDKMLDIDRQKDTTVNSIIIKKDTTK